MLKNPVRGGTRRFLRDRRGVSAVEFAFIAPILILLMGGSAELSAAVTTANRATFVAEGIAQMVSQVKTPISATEMTNFIRSAPLLDPDIVTYARVAGTTDLTKAVSVTVSSVVFTPTMPDCVSDCTYDAHVVFSASLADWPKRSCGTLTPGTGGLAQLPEEAFGPSSLVVVDVETFYRPMLTMFFSEHQSFKRTAFFRPRHVEHVNYAGNCPGYPVT